ncbi:MAG: hypothetical protein AB7N91_21340 [Candidatus Tectimicrobiota bacterium]
MYGPADGPETRGSTAASGLQPHSDPDRPMGLVARRRLLWPGGGLFELATGAIRFAQRTSSISFSGLREWFPGLPGRSGALPARPLGAPGLSLAWSTRAWPGEPVAAQAVRETAAGRQVELHQRRESRHEHWQERLRQGRFLMGVAGQARRVRAAALAPLGMTRAREGSVPPVAGLLWRPGERASGRRAPVVLAQAPPRRGYADEAGRRPASALWFLGERLQAGRPGRLGAALPPLAPGDRFPKMRAPWPSGAVRAPGVPRVLARALTEQPLQWVAWLTARHAPERGPGAGVARSSVSLTWPAPALAVASTPAVQSSMEPGAAGSKRPGPGASSSPVAAAAIDLQRLTEQVYTMLERKLRIERTRRGL